MYAVIVASTMTVVSTIGGMVTALDQLLGGGLLAIIVKFALDGLKLILPKKTLIKRLMPVMATLLAIILWALYQLITGHGNFASLLTIGLSGGLGAIGLNEIVNTAIRGNVVPVVPTDVQAPK